jgi:ADP-ribose pyrophosphatase
VSHHKKVVGLQVDGDETLGEGGFLAVRRVRLRNRYDGGGLSEPYVCDFAVRPMGVDAVVVAVYARTGDGTQVLVRDGLRPALPLGRGGNVAVPMPETRDYLFFTELVAGIVEAHDEGEAGLRRRAAEETHEEAGYVVDADTVWFLGAATFPTPGSMPERFWLTAVEVADPADQRFAAGDGSPMEEGATCRWMALDDAIAACVSGEIEDMKTEVTLRRLRDTLTAAHPEPAEGR